MTFLPSRKEWQRFARFLVVGLSGTALDFFILVALKAWGWPTGVSNVLSFSAGIVNNYTWNRRWTFADTQTTPHARLAQFAQFALVSGIDLALNTLLVLVVEGVDV